MLLGNTAPVLHPECCLAACCPMPLLRLLKCRTRNRPLCPVPYCPPSRAGHAATGLYGLPQPALCVWPGGKLHVPRKVVGRRRSELGSMDARASSRARARKQPLHRRHVRKPSVPKDTQRCRLEMPQRGGPMKPTPFKCFLLVLGPGLDDRCQASPWPCNWDGTIHPLAANPRVLEMLGLGKTGARGDMLHCGARRRTTGCAFGGLGPCRPSRAVWLLL